MQTYKKVLVGFISFFLFLALMTLFAFSSVDRTVLNENFYTQFIKNTDVIDVLYTEAKENLEQAITEEIDEDDQKAEEILNLLFQTLDDEFIEEQILKIADELFEFLYDGGSGEIVIDLTDKKDEFEQKIIAFARDEGMDEEEANELASEVISEIGLFDEEIEFYLEDIEEFAFIRNNISLFKVIIYTSIMTSIVLLSLFMAFLLKDKKALKFLSITYFVSSLIFIFLITTVINVSIPLLLENFDLSREVLGSTMFIIYRVIFMPMLIMAISIIMYIVYLKLPQKKE